MEIWEAFRENEAHSNTRTTAMGGTVTDMLGYQSCRQLGTGSDQNLTGS